MFSLIVPTRRDITALRPLFISSSEKAEIIIIDSDYNEKTKQELKELNHKYYKVTYAPPRQREQDYPYDMMSAVNTGIAYSENPWIMKIDDNWELMPGFFDKLQEDIDFFSKQTKKLVIRPLELEPWMGDTKWNSFISHTQRYFRLPHPPLGRKIPIETIGQAIYNIDAMYDINGWPEIFDHGYAWNDNDMFLRFINGDYSLILDKELLIFRYPHKSTGVISERDMGCKLFKENVKKMLAGKIVEYKTDNPFSFFELHKKLLKEKDRYVISEMG